MAGTQILGRYRLERVLGKGAMGIVYEALDPKLQRKVAIKTIRISQLDEEVAKDFSMRFEREARAVARLNHPNIVQVYDFGEEDEVAFLVMEFISGSELQSSLAENRPIGREQCVRVMCELLDALDFAHEAGVIHRDIKPANVMLDAQGRAKLTDFGVARITDSDKTSVQRTQAGTMIGTPSYMSPEQIQGQAIDRRTDIFSAGIILHQLLTGRRPFAGKGAWEVAKEILQQDPPAPSSLNAEVSEAFDRVVAKALAKDPDARFQTAREFSRALQGAAEGKAALEDEDAATIVVRSRSGARPPADDDDATRLLRPRAGARAEAARPAGENAPVGVERAVGRALSLVSVWKKKRSLLVAGALGVLALAGALAYFATNRSPQPAVATAPEAGAGEKAAPDAAEDAKGADEAQAKDEAEAQAEPEPETKTKAVRKSPVKPDAERKPQRAAAARAKRETATQAQAEGEAATETRAARRSRAKAGADAEAQGAAGARAKRETGTPAQAEGETLPSTRAARRARAKADAAPEAQGGAEAPAQSEAEAPAQRGAGTKTQRDAKAAAKPATESAFWESIRTSRDPADFRNYLSQYPKGTNAEAARRRLARLEEERRSDEAKLAAEKGKAQADPRKDPPKAQADPKKDPAKPQAEPKKDPAKAKPVIVIPTF